MTTIPWPPDATSATIPAMIQSIPFGERPGEEYYNAAEVISLGDSRFLFWDNKRR